MSPEMYMAAQTAVNTGIMLFIVGAVLGGNAAADAFQLKNKHTAFATSFVAAVGFISLKRANSTIFR